MDVIGATDVLGASIMTQWPACTPIMAPETSIIVLGPFGNEGALYIWEVASGALKTPPKTGDVRVQGWC